MRRLAWLGLLLAPLCMAGESRVYLLANVELGGTTYGQSVLLHEADITRLEDCESVRLQSLRDKDWGRYHHVFQRHKAKGFTVQISYRCVLSEQVFEPWYDRDRYDHTYLFLVDGEQRLRVEKTANMARCTTTLASLRLPAGTQEHCAKSNQRLLAP